MDNNNSTEFNTNETPAAGQGYYQMPGPKPVTAETHTTRRPFVKIIALVLICTILGGLAGAGGAALVLNNAPAADSTAREAATVLYEASRTAELTTTSVVTGKEYTAAEIYSQNVKSTVGISTSIVTNYWGFQTTSAASGSGFIISSDGYILTNYHVIEDAETVTVTTYDNTAYNATVIGHDESNDIAVLKIEAQDLQPVVLGDSDTLRVGDSVVAIGNPLGELTFSLTAGVISALDRSITVSSGVTMNLLQTDCAINSGNSGGALFNMYGEVIGITNAKYSSGSSTEASIDNVGFAIPISSVKDIVESIIEKGYISKPYIGVTISDVSSEAKKFGLPSGAAVYSVTDGAPAALAGIEANDIITAINGTGISSSSDLKTIISKSTPGEDMTFTVYRQGETLDLTVTIGEQQQSALANSSAGSSAVTQDEAQSGNTGGFPFGQFSGGYGK